jgi:hypothetical protein
VDDQSLNVSVKEELCFVSCPAREDKTRRTLLFLRIPFHPKNRTSPPCLVLSCRMRHEISFCFKMKETFGPPAVFGGDIMGGGYKKDLFYCQDGKEENQDGHQNGHQDGHQGSSLSTGFPYKVLCLSTKPEVP